MITKQRHLHCVHYLDFSCEWSRWMSDFESHWTLHMYKNQYLFLLNSRCEYLRKKMTDRSDYAHLLLFEELPRLECGVIDGKATFLKRIIISKPFECDRIGRLNLTFYQNTTSTIFSEILNGFNPLNIGWIGENSWSASTTTTKKTKSMIWSLEGEKKNLLSIHLNLIKR